MTFYVSGIFFVDLLTDPYQKDSKNFYILKIFIFFINSSPEQAILLHTKYDYIKIMPAQLHTKFLIVLDLPLLKEFSKNVGFPNSDNFSLHFAAGPTLKEVLCSS